MIIVCSLSDVVEAKGYYFEGDKKFKIYNGGIFRVNEVEDFKNLFPILLSKPIPRATS